MTTAHEGTITEAMAANVLETRFENLDDATVEHTKSRIIDISGCMIAGANAPGNLALIDLVRDWEGKKQATILVHGGKATVHDAAMVNSIMARSFDFDPSGAVVGDTSIPRVAVPCHISATTVPTGITLGEMTGVNGKELITATLVGDDVAARVVSAAAARQYR